MGALKKTMEYMGFRDRAQDELIDDDDQYENDSYSNDQDEFDSVSHFRSGYEPVTSFSSSSHNVVHMPSRDFPRIVTVCPQTYNEAKPIGDAFREGTPVIMNLTSMSEGEARRMVDFASGLIFGLNGSIERVTNRVFLLTPETIEVSEGSDSDRGRVFNQG